MVEKGVVLSKVAKAPHLMKSYIRVSAIEMAKWLRTLVLEVSC